MASSKPYTTVPGGGYHDNVGDGNNDDNAPFGDDGMVVATQPLDLQQAQDQDETRQRERSMRCKFLLSACLLVGLVFGGKEYYAMNYAVSDGTPTEGAALSGNNPYSLFRGSNSEDIDNVEDDYDGDDAELDDATEEVLDLIDGPFDEDDALGGEVEFEGDLDDEINNGEAEGEFDSDMDNDEEEEEENSESGDDEEEEEGGESEDKESSQDLVAGDEGFESIPLEVKILDPISEPEPSEDIEEFPVAIEDPLTEEEEEVKEEEEEEEEEDVSSLEVQSNHIEEGEELPDYFVPLTPAEREQLKERLRNTLRATKSALLFSSNADAIKAGLANPSPQRTLVLRTDSPKQFMHMHHMKTGGTSLDGLISCALTRQKELNNSTRVPYGRMSECGSRVKTCMEELAKKTNATVVDNVFHRMEDQTTFDPADEALGLNVEDMNICQTSESNVMSYCASLHAVRTFGWKGADKVTVIRNPIDRAWSMYRFSLQGCYKCREMKDVLKTVLNGTFVGRKTVDASGKERVRDSPDYAYSPNDSCAVQMIGHQSTNLLSSVDLYNVANDVSFPREQEIVQEAVRNLREEFTWIGLTDRIEDSINGMRTVFPFLAENLNEYSMVIRDMFEEQGETLDDDARFALPEGYSDDRGCKFEHRNAGRTPSCGTEEMDEETISLIKKLNYRDMAVYQAAVERFELQVEVLNEYTSGSL